MKSSVTVLSSLLVIGCGDGTGAVIPTPVPPVEPVVERVVAGGSHVCALMSDTTVRCWGRNVYMELGSDCGLTWPYRCDLPATVWADNDFTVPLSGVVDLALGDNRTCAIREDGRALCWGDNFFGDLGSGDWGVSVAFPPVLNLLTDIETMSLGWSSCAIREDKSLWCWGMWHDGPASAVPIRSPWVDQAIALPSKQPWCVVTADRTVMCRGRNEHGQVGDGTFEERDAFTPVVGLQDVAAVARSHTTSACALRSDGSVTCWGFDTASSGRALEDSPVPLAVEFNGPIAQIDCGWGSCCALGRSGDVWCWGGNHRGQLGDGTTEDSPSPVRVAGLENVRMVTVGEAGFACALKEDRTVWCWGNNRDHQLGPNVKNWKHPLPVQVPFSEEEIVE